MTLRQLAVGGRELMDLGMKPGRELGSMLSELLEYVLMILQETIRKSFVHM